MGVKLLDHVNIQTADLAGTVDFYVDVIGLEQGARPTTIGRPGAWLYCNGRPLIHLIENERFSEEEIAQLRRLLKELDS